MPNTLNTKYHESIEIIGSSLIFAIKETPSQRVITLALYYDEKWKNGSVNIHVPVSKDNPKADKCPFVGHCLDGGSSFIEGDVLFNVLKTKPLNTFWNKLKQYLIIWHEDN